MIKVKSAKYMKNYEIKIEFSDGYKGIVDLKDELWGPIFEPLKIKENFEKFVINDVFNTISWENGADFAPEFLYEKTTKSV